MSKPVIQKVLYPLLLTLLSLLAIAAYTRNTQAQASPQYPVLDMVANKVIQKYQSSSCEQLWIRKSQKASPGPEEQKAIAFLKSDPQMRTVFIDKVSAPIANKLFECGMIP